MAVRHADTPATVAAAWSAGSCTSPWISHALGGAEPGSQLVAAVTEVPGSEVADAGACFVDGNDLKKSLAYGAFVCRR
jgi:hypothetical protein